MILKMNVTRMISQDCRSVRKQSAKAVDELPFSVSGIIEILERYGKIAGSETTAAPMLPPPSAAPLPRYPPLAVLRIAPSE